MHTLVEFDQLLAASVHCRIATGPHTERKALTLRIIASNPLADNPCIARLSGFSLHSLPSNESVRSGAKRMPVGVISPPRASATATP